MASGAAWRPARRAAGLGAFGVTPVTASDLKAHARIDFADEDAVVAACLAAAADHVEQVTGRLLTERAATLALAGFPPLSGLDIELPGGRVSAVASVAYHDAGGAALTLDAADWYLDAVSVPARIGLAGGSMWPITRPWGLPVTISYSAGYADGAQPPALLQAVRLIATELFEQRRDGVIGAAAAVAPVSSAALMAPFVIQRMF